MSNARQNTIRAVALQTFIALNEKRLSGEYGTPVAEMGPGKAATLFRRDVNTKLEKEFSISHASACSHYNYALTEMQKNAPEKVEGLGRPEEKKGGRKTKDGRATAVTYAKLFAKAEEAEKSAAKTQDVGEGKVGDAPEVAGDTQAAGDVQEAQEAEVVKSYEVFAVKDGSVQFTGTEEECVQWIVSNAYPKPGKKKMEYREVTA